MKCRFYVIIDYKKKEQGLIWKEMIPSRYILRSSSLALNY